MSDPIVIVDIARTPMGGFQGSLSSLTAPQLGSAAIAAAVSRAGISPEDVQEVLMGNVLTAGIGQAPTRQAVLGAGLPLSTTCAGVSKVCGSGMKAVMLAHDLLKVGTNDVMVAGGMESMTNAPYLQDRARGGYRLGHGKVMDHMFLDGLEDAYFDRGALMGTFAEQCADHFKFSREQQDDFAIASLSRANAAIEAGRFEREITPVTIKGRGGDTEVTIDEQPGNARPEKIPSLRPAFRKDGTVTPANSSSISDGAAALVMMRASEAERRGLSPKAIIHGHAGYAGEPCWFTTAPVYAMQNLLQRLEWNKDEVDLWEINEAFAVVTMAAMREMNLDHEKVNINGGACALGHPIGASGARILVTLLAALENQGLKRGIASLCIGGGEATAVAIERV
ncbi:acetyl-CoA C-acyltransferase [Sedimenticola selenatireducens]|jgi:acetyl-CoA C-acetyltransferase|uniref:Acetyl-CoA C-acyltransferase n=1 Tax=Sedimenticola selenatireducens TaxID=191960 RepID=A0A558DM47_9GAMM|nr:acetyl-CoA C-acyltransferase [Sedimenticola selenatireducens]TVO78726.1 acetyl-CoA C-acyltransferase [Sedimenticola selenatireducens]TVT62088.1 MAG: acetyl-CoA C-acyltransferase [Sedimenticola selenatireducens]